jgi:hypothetical protein
VYEERFSSSSNPTYTIYQKVLGCRLGPYHDVLGSELRSSIGSVGFDISEGRLAVSLPKAPCRLIFKLHVPDILAAVLVSIARTI